QSRQYWLITIPMPFMLCILMRHPMVLALCCFSARVMWKSPSLMQVDLYLAPKRTTLLRKENASQLFGRFKSFDLISRAGILKWSPTITPCVGYGRYVTPLAVLPVGPSSCRILIMKLFTSPEKSILMLMRYPAPLT